MSYIHLFALAEPHDGALWWVLLVSLIAALISTRGPGEWGGDRLDFAARFMPLDFSRPRKQRPRTLV